MAQNTKIQWTDATVNFWTGCTKVSSGCKYCYMYRGKEQYKKDPTKVVKTSMSTISNTLRSLKTPSLIFTCSWSDFFIEEADPWRDWAWEIIRKHPQHTWQILTKRPERIIDCLPSDWGMGYPNVWLGVTAEDDEMYQDRVPLLLQAPAVLRFVSIEPILGSIDLEVVVLKGQLYYPLQGLGDIHPEFFFPKIDWVIVGGESGNDNGLHRYRESHLDWYLSIVEQCQKAKVPVFVKQLGTHLAKTLKLKDRHGGVIEQWPIGLQIRQMPKF